MKVFKVKINENILAVLAVLSYILFILLPLLLMARYDHPSADDFGYGHLTFVTWHDTHSLLSVFQAAWQTMMHTYETWQGTYSSIFMMALTPVAFGEQYYIAVPFMMLLSLTFSVLYLAKVVIHDLLKSSHSSWIITGIALLLIMVEEIYTPASAFFWYNSAVHYTFMQACMLLLIAFSIQMISVPKKAWMIVTTVLSVAFSIIVAGSNYVNALSGLLSLVSLFIAVQIFAKNKRKRACLLLLPMLCYAIFFILNITAPGNAVRGANYAGLSPLLSIAKSFLSVFTRGYEWMSFFTLFAMIAIIPVTLKTVKKINFRFRYPLLVIAFSLCLFAAMFTPSYYSLNCDGLPRALNNAKMMFQLLLFCNEIYLIGYLQRVLKDKKRDIHLPHYICYYLVVALSFCVIFLTCNNKEAYYPSFAAVKYMSQGFAQHYHHQYMERLALLQSDEPVVYLKEMEPKLNLLYIDDVQTDPNDWRNLQVSTWYQKQAVYLLPTEEQ